MSDKHDTQRKWVELNQADLDWFYSTYPDANLSAFLTKLFGAFREVTEFTPDYYVKLAAEKMRDEINENG